ncbi:aminoacyl-tRNA hydrolase [Candidatus Saccharibacteria bacterium]|nr:aminoacyl-tRNA hydrolase [Candidatus Saccharibacteria bacterium]
MKLIIGFGNPGREYNFTRHNFGFLALDFYAKIHNLAFKSEPKFFADTARTDDIIFVKPQTFYNRVGESVAKLVKFYKLDPASDILIVCDDFDLPFGTLRSREQGSSAGNNGLKSTVDHLKTTQFHRLRLGTNNPLLRKTLGDVDFVLSKFTPEEREELPNILTEAEKIITKF